MGTLKLFEDVPLSLLREGDGLFFAMVHPHVVQLEFLRPVDLRAVVAWLDHDPTVHPVTVLLVVFERSEFCTRRAQGTRVGDSRVPLPLSLVVKLLDDFLSEAGATTDALAATGGNLTAAVDELTGQIRELKKQLSSGNTDTIAAEPSVVADDVSLTYVEKRSQIRAAARLPANPTASCSRWHISHQYGRRLQHIGGCNQRGVCRWC